MAIEIYRYDATSTTKSTRDVIPDASLSPNLARGTSGPYSMQQGPQTISSFVSGGKKRRISKAKTGKSLARSISTPQLRGNVMSDSEADKKRNKLGYQRISIACAHCRRRKIRCLVSDGDPRSRCQNCIRLKKECVFYPVDQQSAVENKSQSSKAAGDTGASSTVSSSPPEIGTGRPFDERQEVPGPPTLPSNAPSSFPGLPREPGSAMSSQGSFPPPDYNYSQPPESPWTPQNGFAPHAPPLHHEQHPHLNPNFMRYNHVVSPGDVTPFYVDATHSRPDAPGAQQYQYFHQRPDPHWQQQHQPPPPLRSMSYDQARDMQSGDPYTAGYHPDPAQHYSQMRPMPLSIGMQSPAVVGNTTSPHSAPIPGYPHAYPAHSRTYIGQPEVQVMQNAGTRPEYPGQWYQPHLQFAPMAEEAPDPHYTNQDKRPG